MYLVFKLKVDRKQQVYWSGRVIHEGIVTLEIISDTFDPNNLRAYRDAYERCTVRVMKEIAKMKDQAVIQHMLLQDDIKSQN